MTACLFKFSIDFAKCKHLTNLIGSGTVFAVALRECRSRIRCLHSFLNFFFFFLSLSFFLFLRMRRRVASRPLWTIAPDASCSSSVGVGGLPNSDRCHGNKPSLSSEGAAAAPSSLSYALAAPTNQSAAKNPL